jgi:hypothetical protein
MSEAIPPLSQYAFMEWCSVKAQAQLYLNSRRGGLRQDFVAFTSDTRVQHKVKSTKRHKEP